MKNLSCRLGMGIRVLLLILVCTLWGNISVQAEGKDKVRVAFPSQDRMTEIDENGTRSGYTYEYLQEIAKYTGWEYEYIELEGSLDEQLSQMLVMLRDGEIDLMGGMVYNEQLTEWYDFPGSSYGTGYSVLCTLEENTELTSSTYYQYPVLKVAVLSTGKANNEKLNQYAEMSGFTVEEIPCETLAEQIEKVENGEADAFLSKDVAMPQGGYKILTSFSPQPFYFATTRGNKAVVNKLNDALASILQNNPYFMINLTTKYFSAQSEKMYFTREEAEFIVNAEPLKVAVLGSKPPIQYFDEDSGEYKGVSIDVLKYISEQTGLQFEVVMTESYEEYTRMLEEDEINLALGVSDELQKYDWQKKPTTMAYMEAPLSIAMADTEDDSLDLQGKRLALAEGYSYGGEYNGTVVNYGTTLECLEAVVSGKADYCYVNTYSLQYFAANPDNGAMISVPQDAGWTQHFCIRLENGENEVLLGILNKAIQSFKKQALLKNSLYENAYRPREMSFSEYLMENPQELCLGVLVIILIVIVLMIALNNYKDRKSQELRNLENKRYEQIREISNEYLFEYNVKEDCIKMTEKCAGFLGKSRVIHRISKRDDINEEFLVYLKNGKDASGEIQFELSDGKKCWIRVITKWISDNNGRNTYLVGKIIDIQHEMEEKRKLLQKAEIDSLTGMYNMAAFRERVEEQMKQNPKGMFVFFIIDVDKFKQVNDECGHYVGDCVLKRIGEGLSTIFKGEGEHTGRLGGDEFVAHMPYTGDRSRIEEKYSLLAEWTKNISFPELTIKVTVSVGAAVIDAEVGFEAAYKRADKVLYEVKDNGRNSFSILDWND